MPKTYGGPMRYGQSAQAQTLAKIESRFPQFGIIPLACLIRGVRPTDVTAIIPSKSRTPPAVREAAIRSPPGPQATGRMSRPKTTEPGSGGLSDCVSRNSRDGRHFELPK